MKVELGISESAKTKRNEFVISLKVTDVDAAHAVLEVLAHMQKDCSYGHGSVYVMDAEGDDKAETYIDGDGGADVSSITCSVNGGDPIDVTYVKMKAKEIKLLP